MNSRQLPQAMQFKKYRNTCNTLGIHKMESRGEGGAGEEAKFCTLSARFAYNFLNLTSTEQESSVFLGYTFQC
jgi:hypothetical protein